jgi:integrase/recombinase XerD
VADIDAARQRVHIRDAKGNKNRLVLLPDATLKLLRQFWQVHHRPQLLFPNRKVGLKGAASASGPLAPAGVQIALRQVAKSSGLKKRALSNESKTSYTSSHGKPLASTT